MGLLDIWVIACIFGCAELFVLFFLTLTGEDTDFVFENPCDSSILALIVRTFLSPVYIFCATIGVLTSPIWIPVLLYKKITSVKNFFNSIGNFFKKKPLAFLKNYKLKFERK